MKYKKGLSAVVATLLLVLLSVVAVGIVWGVINNMVKEGLESSEACYDIFGKISINKAYTCWDTSSSEFQFSINREEIDVDKIIVSIAAESATNSYEIPGSDSNMKKYGGTYGETLALPENNAGLTYVIKGLSEVPDSITIIPVINEEQCDAVDVLYDIENC